MATKTISKPKLHTLLYDLDIEDYHRGTVGHSSSQLKDALEDESEFVEKHIRKSVEREEIAAFDVGTYFHTGVLEPHKLKDDTVIFPGKVRRGEAWEKFKAKNKGRAIVTTAQKDQAETLVKAVKKNEIAKRYLNGKPEVSLFVEIAIYQGVIYVPYFGKRLDRDGWADDLTGSQIAKKKGIVFIVKVRADMLGADYVSDLKSTTGNARSNQAMRYKISDYHYDLSAALYVDMFALLTPVNKFIWIFASKDKGNCRCYRASTNNMLVGRAKYSKALVKIAELSQNDWEPVDFLDTLEPMPHEMKYLESTQSDGDLL